MTFQQDIVSDEVAPPFLQGPFGTALLGAIGQTLDALKARSNAAAKNGMPGQGDPSALPLLGLDRLLLQGPGETNAAFNARLSGAFDMWQRAGNDWTVLEQCLKQILPLQPPALIVSNTSAWSYYGASADTTRPPLQFLARVANWNWDGNVEPIGTVSTPWWRMWMVLFSYAPNAWATASLALGGGGPVLGANPGTTSLGFANVGPQFWVTLRNALIAAQKAQHAWLRWIVVCFDSAHFQPDAPAGGGVNPDGTFGPGYAIASNNYVSTRFASCRYVPGVI
jgi:hypothetical protein